MHLYKVKAKDFCCFEEFELPLYKAGLVWVTGENKDSKAANNNGSGKSTLFKSIVWGLYGQSIDNIRGDKVIRDGAEKARVEITLKDKNKKWKIIRERKHGAPSLKLIQPDKKEFKASKKAIQSKITDMVGLDYPAFKNTVLYGQNDVSRFANPRTRDSDRKETLHRILGIGILKECHEWIRKKKHAVKKRHDELSVQIETAKARIEEQNVDELGKSRASFDTLKRERIKAAKSRLEILKPKVEQDKQKYSELKEVDYSEKVKLKKDVIKKLKENYKKQNSKIKKRSDELDGRVRETKAETLDWFKNRSSAEADLKKCESQLKNLDGDLCPVCNTSLKKGEAKKFVEGIKKEKRQHQTLLRNVDETLEKISKERKKVEGDFVALQVKQNALESYYNDTLEKIREELRLLELKKNKFLMNKQSLKNQIKQNELNEMELSRQLSETEEQENPYDELVRRAKEKIKKYKAKRKGLIKERKEVIKELAHIEFWVHGFSNKGLPSYLLDRVMVDITDRANHYLGILSDGDISMEFETQSEMASSKGDLKDEINISWVIEGMEDSYPPSGGQLKKMELATDLALMDLAQSQEGAQVDLLALDEVLDGLDQEGVQRVLMLLREMRRDRGSIFVISHESDMFELFEKSVTVTKKDGISSLEVRA
jgi:DNA repair exonuclease SbcCD ATPase subunit